MAASFQLNPPNDWELDFEKRRKMELENQKQRSIVDLARPAVEADINYKNSLTDLNIENTREKKALFPSEKIIKKVQADTAQETFKEWMSTAEGRNVAAKMQQTLNEDLLDWMEKNPKKAVAYAHAEAALQKSRADVLTITTANAKRLEAYNRIQQLYLRNNQDLSKLNQNIPYINAEYKRATGHDLVPEGVQLTAPMIAKMMGEREALVETQDYLTKRMQADAQANSRGAENERLQLSIQNAITKATGTALANVLNFDLDSNGNPITSKVSKDEAAQIQDTASLTSSLVKKYYDKTHDIAKVQEVASRIATNFQRVDMNYILPWKTDSGIFILPKQLHGKTLNLDRLQNELEKLPDDQAKQLMEAKSALWRRQAIDEQIQALGLQR